MLKSYYMERELPDAVFASSDIVALSFMKYLSDQKINTPQDIAVVGFDGADMTELVSPRLTTINFPARKLGLLSARILFDDAKAAEEGGASSISGIDTIRSLMGVNIDSASLNLPTYGGLSGPAIKPIALAVISMISNAVKIPVCGIGGISNYKDVVEYLMIGASAVQIGTAIITHGYDNIKIILNELGEWMTSKGYESITDLKGLAAEKIISFQDLQSDPVVANLKTDCNNTDCGLCIKSCLYDAIDVGNGNINIIAQNCSGCGICIDRCPDDLIKFGWYTP